MNYNLKNRGERERGYQNVNIALVFCLDHWMSLCYTWQPGAENRPPCSPFIHLSLSCLVLCLSFSPSLPLIYHRYSGICLQGAAGGAERCKVHFCPPVRACVGPGGHQPKGPGQFYCPVAFQSMKDMVRRVLGGWGVFKTGGAQP